MYLLKKGLFIPFTVFFIYFYNGCVLGVGPNQILFATSYYTSNRDGRVALRPKPSGIIVPLSVPGLLSNSAEEYKNYSALSYKSNGKWVTVKYPEYKAKVRTVAKAFISLGLKKHHGVGILGSNSPEWFYSSLGAIHAGGLSAAMNTTYTSENWFKCLLLSQANIVVVEDDKLAKEILRMKKDLPDLRKIIQCKGTPIKHEDVLSWKAMMDRGEAEIDFKLEGVLDNMGVNECCTLLFTYGIKPTALMFSHDNLVFNTLMIDNYLPVENGKEVIVSFLPLTNIEVQMFDIYNAIAIGAHVYFPDKDAYTSMDFLVKTLRHARPTMFMGFPGVWKKLKNKICEMERQTNYYNTIVRSFASLVKRVLPGSENDEDINTQFVWYTYGSLKASVGFDRTNVFIAAGEKMDPEIKRYLMKLDIIIAQIYGMPECTGTHAISNPMFDGDGVDRRLEGVKSEIYGLDDDGNGELCITGCHVFMGYLDSPEKTAKTIDTKGWLHTGELAKRDGHGFVYVLKAMKDVEITSKTENEVLEDSIKAKLSFISNAFVVGGKRPFLTVLLSLKCESVGNSGEPLDDLQTSVIDWLHSINVYGITKVSEIIDKKPEKVYEAIQNGIDFVNAKHEEIKHKIKAFEIIHLDFSLYNDELDEGMKFKRDVVERKYKDVIAKMYQKEDNHKS